MEIKMPNSNGNDTKIKIVQLVENFLRLSDEQQTALVELSEAFLTADRPAPQVLRLAFRSDAPINRKTVCKG